MPVVTSDYKQFKTNVNDGTLKIPLSSVSEEKAGDLTKAIQLISNRNGLSFKFIDNLNAFVIECGNSVKKVEVATDLNSQFNNVIQVPSFVAPVVKKGSRFLVTGVCKMLFGNKTGSELAAHLKVVLTQSLSTDGDNLKILNCFGSYSILMVFNDALVERLRVNGLVDTRFGRLTFFKYPHVMLCSICNRTNVLCDKTKSLCKRTCKKCGSPDHVTCKTAKCLPCGKNGATRPYAKTHSFGDRSCGTIIKYLIDSPSNLFALEPTNVVNQDQI